MVLALSVVIHNFNVMRVPVAPHKTHPPLVVDANAVLSKPVTGQCFQPVARRHPQKIQRSGSVDLLQLAHGNAFELDEPRHTLACKQALRVFAMESDNHA